MFNRSHIWKTEAGKTRRLIILDYLSQTPTSDGLRGLPVNKKWQLNIQRDSDLQRLLKLGYVKRHRPTASLHSWFRSSSRQTYLTITEKGSQYLNANQKILKKIPIDIQFKY